MLSNFLCDRRAGMASRSLRLIGLSSIAGAMTLCVFAASEAQETRSESNTPTTAAPAPASNAGVRNNAAAASSVAAGGTDAYEMDRAAEPDDGNGVSTGSAKNRAPPTAETTDQENMKPAATAPVVRHQQTDIAPSSENAAASDNAMDEITPPREVPSLLDDPAGALRQILATPERRTDLPHDLSPWGMFMNADIVVKVVMSGLAFASLVTWTIWLAKMVELAGARARVGKALKVIRSSRSLDEAVGQMDGRGGPAALMLRAARQEADLSEAAIDHAGGGGLKERVSSALGRIEAFAGRRISKGTGLLATIGSTAPFVGLFGTVWGIMNSFIGISEAQTTDLAVVAPGIAEALLATAIGLVAAIPAVIIYNVFARSITGYRQLLADAASGVERLVSRDLDFRKIPGARAVPNSAGSLHAVSGGRGTE